MSMTERLNTALYTARRSAIREFSNLAARTPGCVRLTLGEPDFATPAPVCDRVGAALEAGQTHYIPNNGTMSLRERIAAYTRERHGLPCTAENVIVTAGAAEALFIALFGILNPGDEVIVPSPAFVLYREIVNLCRGVTVDLPTADTAYQIRPEALAGLITSRTKAIILNSPHNPTGTVYDAESLETVYHAVKGREIFVLCDDVYRDLFYGGAFHSFAEFSDLGEQILVAQSFSKSFAMTGWRMGWLQCAPALRERLELVHQYMITSTPAPFQEACITALEQDNTPMIREYTARRRLVLDRLARMGLETVEPAGAFYVFPSIVRFGLGSAEFCTRLLLEAGVAVTPGAAFGADDHIRISYCCSEEDISLGLDRLEGFLRKLEGENHAN